MQACGRCASDWKPGQARMQNGKGSRIHVFPAGESAAPWVFVSGHADGAGLPPTGSLDLVMAHLPILAGTDMHAGLVNGQPGTGG